MVSLLAAEGCDRKLSTLATDFCMEREEGLPEVVHAGENILELNVNLEHKNPWLPFDNLQ